MHFFGRGVTNSMKIDKTNIKVLIILSEINTSWVSADIDLATYITSLHHPYIEFDCLVDPSRKELEYQLHNNNYLCIIPCTPYSLQQQYNEKFELDDFNIIHLLENLNLNFFGCNYITNLMLNDRAAYLKSSEKSLPLKILTRYNYEDYLQSNNLKEDFFPAIIDPLYNKNFIATQKYKAQSLKDAFCIVSNLFNNDQDMDEVLIQKNMYYDKEVTVNILGNPPQSIDLIFDTTLNSKENTLEFKNEFHQIIAKSYELFNHYSIRDFAQFKYGYRASDNKFYLISINVSCCLNDIFVSSCMQYYGIKLEDLLNILVIISLNRQTATLNTSELTEKISSGLPDEIKNNLLSLETKIHIYNNYDYKDVCHELKNRFLKPDESNKYDFLKLLQSTINKLPVVDMPGSLFIGTSKDKHDFLKGYEEIPLYPREQQEILHTSVNILNGQMRWHTPSMLYNVNPPVMFNTVVASALTNLYNPNAMAQATSAGFLKMECQIARQLSTLIGWDSDISAGVFTTGGKVCITYAIKCGLNRCLRYENSNKEPVVITSETNHFSIESSCNQLGLTKDSCIRIPVNSSGTIDFQVFEEVLIECFKSQIPIACIIFSGGNTTHCAVENIKQGKEILNRVSMDLNIQYSPYVYYDLVVGWPWLFFKYYDFIRNTLNIDQESLRKIKTIADYFNYAYIADGIGIDFHKGGFAPFTNSIFLSQRSSELYSVSNNPVKDIFREPYHYTFSNSRSATDIISAWNVLQSVGIQGFQSYVANMVNVANTFMEILPQYGFDALEKNNTYGFSTIVWAYYKFETVTFHDFKQLDKSYIDANNNYLYKLSEYLKKNPVSCYYVRFLPKYKKITSIMYIATIAILPMTLNIEEQTATIIANNIGMLKMNFDQQYPTELTNSNDIMPEEVPK